MIRSRLNQERLRDLKSRFVAWFYSPIARGWALLAFGVLAFGIGLAIQSVEKSSDQAQRAIVNSGRVISVAGCNRDYEFTGVIRAQLAASRRQIERARTRGDLSNARARENDEFFATQLALIKRPDCREAVRVVTDNPDNIRIGIPPPLYDKNLAERTREAEKAEAAEALAIKVEAQLRARRRARAELRERVKEKIRRERRSR